MTTRQETYLDAMRAERRSRMAKLRECPKCGRDVFVGPDSDGPAWVATVDTGPLSPQHEHALALAGVNTFTLSPYHGGSMLDYRRPNQRQPGNPLATLHREHACPTN